MSQPVHPTAPLASVPADQKPKRDPVPVWLLILLLVLLYWGMVYFDERGGWFEPEVYVPYRSIEQVAYYQPPMGGDRAILDRGKVVYESVCALCHNPDGMGKPNQAPPLAGSEWVQGSPSRLLRIPLYGLNGPISVKGQQMSFPASMPAMGATMPPEDLAAVLSYMRQAWGNKGAVVAPEEVKAISAKVGNHPQPFTPEEVLQAPEK